MALSISRAVQTVVAASITTLLIVACGSSSSSEFDNGGKEDSGGTPPTGSFNTEDAAGGGGGAACKPKTCAEQAIECGPAGDGCGGIIADCGKCGAGQRCGGPNAPSKCVSTSTATSCTPKTCTEVGVSCGPAGDGCGGLLQCGTCGAGQQCGGIGKPSQCVAIGVIGGDGGACVPKTCTDYLAQGKNCGQQSDGCGGTLSCGTCTAPEFCGGSGPSKCGTTAGGTCTKKTCGDYPVGTCGQQSDGCGGVTAICGTCTAPQTCGGGTTPNVCGGGGVVGPGGGPCVAKTCAQLGKNCGKNADGCGGIVDCGSTCPDGQVCGGNGTPNVCATPPCTPKAACDPGLNCGSQADGCGGTVQCGPPGGCASPAICGGGGQPNVCGGGAPGGPGGCTAATCASLGKNCGQVADGCGGLTPNCGTCTVPGDTCGGSGNPSVCGQPACTPTTCAALGMNCGYAADGCGKLLDCGGPNACAIGQYCGGGGPNKCGVGTPNPACTNYCLDQAICAAGTQTRVTGTVFAPNGTLPLPGALLYVPNASKTYPHGLDTFVDGVASGACQQCSTQASGNPLISTTSNADGTFTLNNVPANTAFPLVIQMGRWRRVVTIPAIAPCTPQALTSEQTRFPRTQGEFTVDRNNIPKVAISTGQVDALECVFRKLGIADSQFTNGGGTGRIHLFQDEDDPNTNANGGARIDTNTTRTQNGLVNSQASLDQYDAVVFGCPGAENTRGNTQRTRVRDYANKGGRVFATHFSYVWLFTTTDFNTSVTWDTANARSSGNGAAAIWPGLIDTSPGKRLLFSQWLAVPAVNALSVASPPQISIQEARNNADLPVPATSESWITKADDPDGAGRAVLHYTFNTPVGAAAASQCGRVLFSDFHVTVGSVSDQTNFPNECNTNPLTSQEKVLAFMLFDLTSCIDPINPPPPPSCTPRDCAQQAIGCGFAGNGCGQQIDCGPCPQGQTCGGGGASQCGGACVPRTCAQANANCGTIPDGCGSLQNCGPCTIPGQTCGGGGTANQCGAPSCTPRTCAQQGLQCGLTGDGCGNTIPCGTCPAGQTCGGGGPGKCGAPSCTPITTCPPGKTCGEIPDNCGGAVNCGQCVPGQICGGGGAPNVCGAASCSPKTCNQIGAQCGGASDGCGNVIDCGVCPAGQICQGNVCVVPTCSPTTCTAQGIQCGPLGDGCGGLLQCGNCPPGQVCGGSGTPGICGVNPCTPKTCAELGAVCGQVANGCGALTPDCGTCQGNTACLNGACVPACTPRSCAQAGAQCGPIADGCGSTVDCGPCPPGLTCGLKSPNQCGSDGVK